MPFASSAALLGPDFEREQVPPSVLAITQLRHGPQSSGADEKPFATLAQRRHPVPTRYTVRRSFPGLKHSPPDVRDHAREPAMRAQKRLARWPNPRLHGKQLLE